jgi:hypothetical protein
MTSNTDSEVSHAASLAAVLPQFGLFVLLRSALHAKIADGLLQGAGLSKSGRSMKQTVTDRAGRIVEVCMMMEWTCENEEQVWDAMDALSQKLPPTVLQYMPVMKGEIIAAESRGQKRQVKIADRTVNGNTRPQSRSYEFCGVEFHPYIEMDELEAMLRALAGKLG